MGTCSGISNGVVGGVGAPCCESETIPIEKAPTGSSGGSPLRTLVGVATECPGSCERALCGFTGALGTSRSIEITSAGALGALGG